MIDPYRLGYGWTKEELDNCWLNKLSKEQLDKINQDAIYGALVIFFFMIGLPLFTALYKAVMFFLSFFRY